MLPNQVLSSVVVLGEYLIPDNQNNQPLRDYELGGIGLNDPSHGLQYQVWTCYYEGGSVKISAPNTLPITLFSVPGITSLTFSFDQNMRPFVSYVANGVAYYYWYDTLTNALTTSLLPGATSVSSAMDDKRKRENGFSDIVLIYTKGNNLYFRAQRDRYGVEYLLKTAVQAKVIKAGMTNKNRVQIKLQGV